MAQGLLSFQYESEPKSTGMTALGGLPLYVDLAHAIGLPESIRQNIRVRKNSDQGWTDPQMVMGGILLNEAGGEHVEDLNVLEKDDGFCRLLMRVEDAGITHRQRRALLRRWRKTERKRGVPSPSAMFRYLEKFHDPPCFHRKPGALARWRQESACPLGYGSLPARLYQVHGHGKERALRCDRFRHWLRRDGCIQRGGVPGRSVRMEADHALQERQIRRNGAGVCGSLLRTQGEKIVKFYRKRCGKSEEAHAVLKSDLSGGVMPSGDFGENAAWWWMAILAMNLNNLLKRHVLQGDWEDRRMKALRYGLIRIAGRVIEHARRLIIRISGEHPASRLLLEARERIAELALPGG